MYSNPLKDSSALDIATKFMNSKNQAWIKRGQVTLLKNRINKELNLKANFRSYFIRGDNNKCIHLTICRNGNGLLKDVSGQ